jgi:hypothetical protein
MEAYKMSDIVYKNFMAIADFDEGGAIEEY